MTSSDVYNQQIPVQIRHSTTRLELWTITESGSVSIVPLATDTADGFARTAKAYTPGILVPDDSGTALVTWSEDWSEDSQQHYLNERHFARATAGSVAIAMTLAPNGPLPRSATTGEGDVLFVSDDSSSVEARDVNSGSLRWSRPAGAIIASTAGGGVLVRDDTLTLALEYSADGTLVSTRPWVGGVPGSAGGYIVNSLLSADYLAAPSISFAHASYPLPGGGGACCRPMPAPSASRQSSRTLRRAITVRQETSALPLMTK